MAPTIAKGDRAIVNRLTYGFNDPKPGDIILFTPPSNFSSQGGASSCKRIIAVGGETFQVRDGNVYVDGQERKLGAQVSRYAYPDSSPPLDFFGESDNRYLAYGVHEPYLVPEGHYFVLGDNRWYSADSRCFGAIPRKNIIGKVVKIYWPPRRMGLVR
jgi:signal peptidase I